MTRRSGRTCSSRRRARPPGCPSLRRSTRTGRRPGRAAVKNVSAAVDELLDAEPWPTGLHVARDLVAGVPSGALLFVGSSNPIRDVDLAAERRSDVDVHANRGVAGIDGSVSTAIGLAVTTTGPAYALMGDLTFLHDSNGLLADRRARPDDRRAQRRRRRHLLVAGTGRAGVRRSFERIFGTPHGTDLAALCAGYRIPHSKVDDQEEFRSATCVAERPPSGRSAGKTRRTTRSAPTSQVDGVNRFHQVGNIRKSVVRTLIGVDSVRCMSIRSKTTAAVASAAAMTLFAGTALAGSPGAPGAGDSYFPKYGNGGYDVSHYDIRLNYNPTGRPALGHHDDPGEGHPGPHAVQPGLPAQGEVGPGQQRARLVRLRRRRADAHPARRRPQGPGPDDRRHLRRQSRRGQGPPTASRAWTKTPDGALAIGEPEIAAWWFPPTTTRPTRPPSTSTSPSRTASR